MNHYHLQHLLAAFAVCGLLPGTTIADDGYFDSNGVKIHYVTEGQGQAVILIHGWMSDSSMWGRDFKGNTKLKSMDGFRAIALDCRGHGKSDKPHDPAKYGPEMAEDVVRLLDQLKIEKAHLVGYSSGAFIAGWVAATHPGRVLSAVYAGQAPLVAGDKETSGTSEVEAFARAVEEGKGLGSYLIAVTPPSRPKPTEAQAKVIADFLYRGKDLKAFVLAGRSFKDLVVPGEQLKRCKAPVLFIRGGNESDSVKRRVAAVHELLGRGEVKVVEGADHITTLTNPEFAASIQGFLRAVRVK